MPSGSATFGTSGVGSTDGLDVAVGDGLGDASGDDGLGDASALATPGRSSAGAQRRDAHTTSGQSAAASRSITSGSRAARCDVPQRPQSKIEYTRPAVTR